MLVFKSADAVRTNCICPPDQCWSGVQGWSQFPHCRRQNGSYGQQIQEDHPLHRPDRAEHVSSARQATPGGTFERVRTRNNEPRHHQSPSQKGESRLLLRCLALGKMKAKPHKRNSLRSSAPLARIFTDLVAGPCEAIQSKALSEPKMKHLMHSPSCWCVHPKADRSYRQPVEEQSWWRVWRGSNPRHREMGRIHDALSWSPSEILVRGNGSCMPYQEHEPSQRLGRVRFP